jgi:hypothetical protein
VLGLQGRGTPRANPHGRGLEGFIAIAEDVGAKTLEMFEPWLAEMDAAGLARLRDRLAALGMTPVVSGGLMMGPVDRAIAGTALGAVIRLALTTVLCGDRAASGGVAGAGWPGAASVATRRRSRGAGVTLAVENHQDFGGGARRLVRGGRDLGQYLLRTGNSAAEAPLGFRGRAARHPRSPQDCGCSSPVKVILVRCAIGDGAVPIAQIAHSRRASRPSPRYLNRALERAVRFLTSGWWLAPAERRALAACLAAARHRRLPKEEDYRTPWERGEDGAQSDYEMDMIRKSAANMRDLGLMEQRQ